MNFPIGDISDLKNKIPVRTSFESHAYLTSVPAAKLRWHLSPVKYWHKIQKANIVSINDSGKKKMENNAPDEIGFVTRIHSLQEVSPHVCFWVICSYIINEKL